MPPSQFSVAVTGSGGGVGQSVIKALSGTDYRLIALDGEALGTGLYAAPVAHVIPYATHPDYIDGLLEICEAEKCDMLFPGLDIELPVLARSVERFKAVGTRVMVSRPSVVEAADDKLRTFTLLREHGISTPETVDMADKAGAFELPLPLPFILKPRLGGARSKNVYLVRDEATYRRLAADPSVHLQGMIAQEYVEGDEFTCGTVSVGGRHAGTIVMRRVLRDGDTYKCFSVRHARVEAEVARIIAALEPEGALNVQLRMRGGEPYVFELNARCSGTTAARALAGFNEPRMIADYYLKGLEPAFTIREVSILRYWKELVVENDAINDLRQKGSRVTESPSSL